MKVELSNRITYGEEVSYCPYCGHHFSGAYFCPECGCEGRDNPNYKGKR